MSFDWSKLENVRHRGVNTIARCPACAEQGNDRKGEHLFINANGQFGCVLYPGANGHKHRQRIYQLACNGSKKDKTIEIKHPFGTFGTPFIHLHESECEVL